MSDKNTIINNQINENEKYIFVEKVWLSTSGQAINFESKGKKYTTSQKDFEGFGIFDQNKLLNSCIIVNANIQIKKIGQSEYYGITKNSIKKVVTEKEDVELCKIMYRKIIDIKNNNCFTELKLIEYTVPKAMFDFNNIYDNASKREISKNESVEMNSAQKLIEESNELTEDKYFNIENEETFNLKFLSWITGGKIFEFIASTECNELIIKKAPKLLIPSDFKNDKDKIINYLKENTYVWNRNLDEAFYLFKCDAIELCEIVFLINKSHEEKFSKMLEMIFKKANNKTINKIQIDWPFIKGRTIKKDGDGEFVFAPMMHHEILVSESLDSIKFTKPEISYEINMYPILKNYVDLKDGKINYICKKHKVIETVLLEFFNHGIRLERPDSVFIEPLRYLTHHDMEEEGILPGNFQIINQATISVSYEVDGIYSELNKIYEIHNDFPFPAETYTVSKKSNKLKDRNYVFNVDDTKSNSIKKATENSIVIFGPPGTGKTETISSIVGEVIKNNKTGLIVAEMSTALYAIEKKLVDAKLDDFILLLDEEINLPMYFKNKINKIKNLIISEGEGSNVLPPINFEKLWVNDNLFHFSLIEEIKNRGVLFKDVFRYYCAVKEYGLSIDNFKKIFMFANLNDSIDKSKDMQLSLTTKREAIEKLYTDVDIKIQDLQRGFLSFVVSNSGVKITINDLNMATSKGKVESLFALIDSRRVKGIFDIIKLSKNDIIKAGCAKYIVDISELNSEKTKIDKLRSELENDCNEINDLINSYNPESIEKANRIIEKYSLNHEWMDKNIDLVEKLIIVLTKTDNINDKWLNHKKMLKENVLQHRLKTKESYSSSLAKKYETDKSFRDGVIRLVKHIEGNFTLNASNDKLITLFNENDKLIRDLFPIVMCKPEIVSSVLPLQQNLFDFAIFDEASQIRLHRALPAIYRAQNVVVAGDDKQLGPTDKFTDIRRVEDFEFVDNDNNKFSFKTLLDFAKGNYENVMLSTHYRSKSKELIKFSNSEFYNNMIEVVDSPDAKFDGKEPIIVENVNGYFEQDEDKELKIVGSRNVDEAKRVVELFVEYVLEKNKTVGIVTFSQPQQKLIQQLINDKVTEMKIAPLSVDGKYFVKNINDVQGDEMDVIIFSVVYGKWKSTNVPVKNFARVSKEKINVAVTRAKYRLHVIKSISANEIDKKKATENEDMAVFQRWLTHVEEYKNEVMQFDEKLDFQTDFEIDYFNEMKKIISPRYKVIPNFNAGAKDIDIAIFDTERNVFQGAIELDGNKYHNSITDREKDYSKQILLEAQGWKIIKTTFWEFYKNPAEKIIDDLISLGVAI